MIDFKGTGEHSWQVDNFLFAWMFKQPFIVHCMYIFDSDSDDPIWMRICIELQVKHKYIDHQKNNERTYSHRYIRTNRTRIGKINSHLLFNNGFGFDCFLRDILICCTMARSSIKSNLTELWSSRMVIAYWFDGS